LIWNIIPNFSKLFGIEEIWYMKPLRKGIQAYAPAGWPQPHNKYIEWTDKPLRPITEREVGYFGSDVFDYEDQMSENIRNLIKDEKNRQFITEASKSAMKEPIDLEDYHF